MAAANLSRSLEQIFGHEGGFSKIRSDPGNWTSGKVGVGKLLGTKYGIAANSYPHLDIPNLTLAKATEIYRRDYAAKVRFNDLPSGVDHAMLDYAINSGPSRAVKDIQREIGAADDGVMGPMTMAGVRAARPDVLINGLCDRRLRFLKGLSTWPTFGRGWTRRVKEVRAFALSIVGAAPPDVPVPEPKPEKHGWLAAILKIIIAFFTRRKS